MLSQIVPIDVHFVASAIFIVLEVYHKDEKNAFKEETRKSSSRMMPVAISPNRSTSLAWYVFVSTPGTGSSVGEISVK